MVIIFANELFQTKLFISLALFVIDIIFGLLPLCIEFSISKLNNAVSWINCFCGGFLLGAVLLQMLFEADNLLKTSLGHFPSAFLIFGLGYLFVLFFEKWIHVLTVEYKRMSRGDFGNGLWLLRDQIETSDYHHPTYHSRQPNNRSSTAYILMISTLIESFISAFTVGTQVDMLSLWTIAIMLVTMEWLQIFLFTFQFRNCLSGDREEDSGLENGVIMPRMIDNFQQHLQSNDSTTTLSTPIELVQLESNNESNTRDNTLNKNNTDDDDDDDTKIARDVQLYEQQRKTMNMENVNAHIKTHTNTIRVKVFVCVLMIAMSNILGIVGGDIFSQVALKGNENIQNICAGVLLAFISGVFMHIATSQMIVKEFEYINASESDLLKKAILIMVGLVVSSGLNILISL